LKWVEIGVSKDYVLLVEKQDKFIIVSLAKRLSENELLAKERYIFTFDKGSD